MEIRAISDKHWIIQFEYKEIAEIRNVARQIMRRPTVMVCEILKSHLTEFIKKHL